MRGERKGGERDGEKHRRTKERATERWNWHCNHQSPIKRVSVQRQAIMFPVDCAVVSGDRGLVRRSTTKARRNEAESEAETGCRVQHKAEKGAKESRGGLSCVCLEKRQAVHLRLDS